MTNEQPATPPLSPKLNNTNEALQVTPVKSYKLLTTTTQSLEMQNIEDADVSRMSPSLEDAVHALTTLESQQKYNCCAKRKMSDIIDDAKQKRESTRWCPLPVWTVPLGSPRPCVLGRERRDHGTTLSRSHTHSPPRRDQRRALFTCLL